MNLSLCAYTVINRLYVTYYDGVVPCRAACAEGGRSSLDIFDGLTDLSRALFLSFIIAFTKHGSIKRIFAIRYDANKRIKTWANFIRYGFLENVIYFGEKRESDMERILFSPPSVRFRETIKVQ